MADGTGAKSVRRFVLETTANLLDVLPGDLDLDTPLYDLGLDSLAVVELVVAIEEQYRIAVNTNTLYQSPTLAELAASIEKRLGERQ